MRNALLSVAAVIAAWCVSLIEAFVRSFVNENGDALMLAAQRVFSSSSIDASALGLLAWTLFLISVGLYFRMAARELRAATSRFSFFSR